jgi:hypothetical protein
MQALFVHGMGRTSLSGWLLLKCLKRSGLSTKTFSYSVMFESLDKIKKRLVIQLTDISFEGDYFVVGHSLGGVLLRDAIYSLPPEVKKPCHLFLLASPTRASRWAKKFSTNFFYQVVTGDCGQLLASDLKMAAIPATNVPKTAFVGDCGWPFKTVFAPNEVNDGILSLSEVRADWITDEVRVHCYHSFLPFCRSLSETILARIALY